MSQQLILPPVVKGLTLARRGPGRPDDNRAEFWRSIPRAPAQAPGKSLPLSGKPLPLPSDLIVEVPPPAPLAQSARELFVPPHEPENRPSTDLAWRKKPLRPTQQQQQQQLEVAVSADPKARPPPTMRLELDTEGEPADAVPIVHIVPPPTSKEPACSAYHFAGDGVGGTLWLGEAAVQFRFGAPPLQQLLQQQGPRQPNSAGYVSGRDGVRRGKLLVVLAADTAAEVSVEGRRRLQVVFRKPSGAEVERQQATYSLLEAEGKTNYTTLLAQMKRGRHRYGHHGPPPLLCLLRLLLHLRHDHPHPHRRHLLHLPRVRLLLHLPLCSGTGASRRPSSSVPPPSSRR